ncbi:hypothetical protein G6L37_05060 [Agrobacterium rubi]|nr:hypothetical protein [Agrobacterium rubi]NTF24725.1 hypothetical protein [Agrobacterium rubi]
MSENKRLLARYDAAIQNYAKLLAKAIETNDAKGMGYDLIEASVTVDQRRDMVIPYAEGWMLEFIAAATNLVRSLVAVANGKPDHEKAAAVGKAVSAYEELRTRYFSAEELASA